MTTYQVFTGGDTLAVEMEADSKASPPTKISGPDDVLVGYAKELVSDPLYGKVPSVEAIASRMGGRSYLVRKDGQDEPPGPDVPRTKVPRGSPVPKNDDEDITLAATTSAIEVPMVSSNSCWVTVYDMDAAVCTITALAGQRHWAELRRDDAISDPGDRFVVLVGDGAQDVQVRLRLDESGVPLALHTGFNGKLLGGLGLTLQPGYPRQFVWWFDTPRSLWRRQRPTTWENQYPSPLHHENGQQQSPDSLRPAKKRVPRGKPGLKSR